MRSSRQAYKTVITSHVNPDFDAVASMVGALSLYPEAALLFPGGTGRRLSGPFVKGALASRAVVRPKELDFAAVERLVVVDTRRPDRIGFARPILQNPGLDIHLFDHHPDSPGDLEGSLLRCEPVGATVTVLSEAMRERGISPDPDEATMLALGLWEDTGSFTFGSTTARDLAAGSWLLSRGADLETVTQLTSTELSTEQVSLLNELIGAAETREVRGMTLAVSMARREGHVEDVAVLAPRLMEMLDLDTVFLLVQMEALVQVTGRSRAGGFSVGEILKPLGGGGHHGAAAAAVKGEPLEKVRQALEESIREYEGRLFRAGSIMVHPAISLSETRPLSEAADMMARYGLHVILAEDAQGRVSGIIREQSVARAMYHGLTAYPVRDFMTTDFETASPEASFHDVKRVIVDQRQRILPVTDPEGKALGVVTRTDLLHLLAAEAGGDEGAESPRAPFDRNLAGPMQERLPKGILEILRGLGDEASSFGVSLYLVGGTVRDLIMSRPIRDLDMTVTGELTAFIKAQAARLGGELRTHPRFKTATLNLPDGTRLDFSSARVEYYEYPGAYPVVRHASIQLDLQRRDFTVNTLAVSLAPEDFGRLLDYYRGYQDIKEGLIRVLHSLSFVEDPTRAFRACRFERRLGFRISRMTGRLIASAVSGGFMKTLSLRRLMGELRIICEEEDPGAVFERMGGLGLLRCISPDLRVTRRHLDLFRNVLRVRDWYRLTFASRFSPMWLVWFAALTFELGRGESFRLADGLEDGRRMLRAFVIERPALERVLASASKLPQDGPVKPSLADSLFGNISWPGILYVMARAGTGPLARAGAAFLTSYRHVRPEVTGDDLIRLGFRPGPGLHKALEVLRRARLDGLVGNREEEKGYVRLFLNGEGDEGQNDLDPAAGQHPGADGRHGTEGGPEAGAGLEAEGGPEAGAGLEAEGGPEDGAGLEAEGGPEDVGEPGDASAAGPGGGS
ncbi:MAG: CBS domain-containing protein [Deltaproteobacteria bacterium]|jgi:tRNA nucleotidyltransferase (CCA-adding enzyme)|nr:CBS domain-containing protein [Deltaproteobacteria bacterium]